MYILIKITLLGIKLLLRLCTNNTLSIPSNLALHPLLLGYDVFVFGLVEKGMKPKNKGIANGTSGVHLYVSYIIFQWFSDNAYGNLDIHYSFRLWNSVNFQSILLVYC